MAQNHHDHVLTEVFDRTKRDRSQVHVRVDGHVEAGGEAAWVADFAAAVAVDGGPAQRIVFLLVGAAKKPQPVATRVLGRSEVLKVLFDAHVLGDQRGLV